MKLQWLGHSCFLFTSGQGSTLVTDPYDPDAYPGQLTYEPVDVTADIVTVSHNHPDHGNVDAVTGDPLVLRAPGKQDAAGFRIRGVPAFHDSQEGSLRGKIVIFVIEVDGVTVCHLGDIGHELSQQQLEDIGQIDVLLLPVGGKFTVDAAGATEIWRQLDAPITIPMHFKNDRCHFDIETAEPFTSGKPSVERRGSSLLEPAQEKGVAGPKIVVLEPAR